MAISWNIAGVRKIHKTWNYIGKFDIILLQETWLEEGNEKEVIGKLSKDFIWKVKIATRESKKGRAKGGVLVGVRKEIAGNVKLEEWDVDERNTIPCTTFT